MFTYEYSIFDEAVRIINRLRNESEDKELYAYFALGMVKYAAYDLHKADLTERQRFNTIYAVARQRLRYEYKHYRHNKQSSDTIELFTELVHALRELEKEFDGADEKTVRFVTPNEVESPKRKTATAYRVKLNERGPWSGYWEEKRISKCWKDQRGKGRNKRNHQYR